MVQGLAFDASAEAQPSSVETTIVCPQLTREQRAALEARARAELAWSLRENGEIVFACDEAQARVSWTSRGEAPRARTRPMDSVVVGTAFVDELLAMLHSLLVERPHPASSDPVDRLSSPPVAPLRLELPVDRLETPRPRPGRTRPNWWVVAGAEAELWQGAVAGAVAGRLGVAAAPSERWSVAALSAFAWGVGSGHELRVWTLSAQLRVDYAPAPFLRLGAGPEVRLLLVDASGLDGGDVFVREGKRQVGVTAGLVVSARFPLVFGPITLSAGPQVEWLVRPVVVDVASDETFRVPSVLAGFAVDLESCLGD